MMMTDAEIRKFVLLFGCRIVERKQGFLRLFVENLANKGGFFVTFKNYNTKPVNVDGKLIEFARVQDSIAVASQIFSL